MQKPSFGKLRHKKLVAVVIIAALLVAGYFMYKYAYIYTERRKYDQAAVAIQKVADDLRSSGIETEFSRGCAKSDAKFNSGSLFCGVSITHKSDPQNDSPVEITRKFMNVLQSSGFKRSSGELDYTNTPFNPGVSLYSHASFEQSCSLEYATVTSEVKELTQLALSCGGLSKFSIY